VLNKSYTTFQLIRELMSARGSYSSALPG
jgi:hypothetical protein